MTHIRSTYSRAVIAPTGYGTFGVWWPENAPAYSYSGPFATREEATERARIIGIYYSGAEPIIRQSEAIRGEED